MKLRKERFAWPNREETNGGISSFLDTNNLKFWGEMHQKRKEIIIYIHLDNEIFKLLQKGLFVGN